MCGTEEPPDHPHTQTVTFWPQGERTQGASWVSGPWSELCPVRIQQHMPTSMVGKT